MDFEEYQKKSRRTAKYPRMGKNYIYPTLGLAGETGEAVDKIKKIIRDDKGQVTPESLEGLKYELGDILWYIAQLATEIGLDLNEIAEANVKKLTSRMKRGKIGGSGDKR